MVCKYVGSKMLEVIFFDDFRDVLSIFFWGFEYLKSGKFIELDVGKRGEGLWDWCL